MKDKTILKSSKEETVKHLKTFAILHNNQLFNFFEKFKEDWERISLKCIIIMYNNKRVAVVDDDQLDLFLDITEMYEKAHRLKNRSKSYKLYSFLKPEEFTEKEIIDIYTNFAQIERSIMCHSKRRASSS